MPPIDAVGEVARGRAVSFLRPEHQQRIELAYKAFVDDAGFAAVATTQQLAAQAYSLSIPLYVKRNSAAAVASGAEQPTLQQAWQSWEVTGREFWLQMDAVVGLLDGLAGED